MTIRLVQTCSACPEQYDAYNGDRKVAYLRLRHGYFRVQIPDCGGETIYMAEPRGDGAFRDDERDYYLRFAIAAILAWIANSDAPARPPAPDVAYTVEA